MKTFSTVEAAVLLVVENFEVNQIVCDTNCIRNRILTWYEHSDVTDPEVLAACALEGKDWYPDATYEDMLNAKEWWFPKNPYDEISIWEIEEAQNDIKWW